MKTKRVRDAQQTKQCVYNILCDCGRCYIDESSRHFEVWTKEHKYNPKQSMFAKSKSDQPTYERNHNICCNEAKVLQVEPNATYRKCKEYAHMPLIHHPISQPGLDISPIWTPLITAEVKKLQLRPVQIEWENLFLCWYHTENVSLLWRLLLW
jgi:hypothetical protein